VNTAELTTDTTQTFSVSGLTRAQLLNGVFGIRVRASRGNSNTGFTASLDAVSVAVTYTNSNNQSVTVTAVGVTTARGADTFGYDGANRLTSATVVGVTETSTYDGDGVRVSRREGAGPLTRYVSDPAAGLPVTLDDGTRRYVWGLGLAYAVSGSGIEVYHADRLGSVRALTDAAGTVIATYRSDEFGVPVSSTGSSTQPFRYTGEPSDASGLTYLRARYYDPSIGRFLSRDPFAGFSSSPLSLNRYGYVENNPTTVTDPDGRCPWCIGAVVGFLPYTGGVVATNVISGNGLSVEGWNVADAVISTAAGATGGLLAGTGLSVGGQVVANAVVGFDATLVSMVAGGRRDARELVIGTGFGALGPVLPGGKGITGAFRGVVSGSIANTGQNILSLSAIRDVFSGDRSIDTKSRVMRGGRDLRGRTFE